jgi:hypothetical protein
MLGILAKEEDHGPMNLPIFGDRAPARERNAAPKLASIALHTDLLKTAQE